MQMRWAVLSLFTVHAHPIIWMKGRCSYAKWNQENESSAYMGLFAVAYGKALFVTSSCQMTAKRLDIDHKDCLHAKAGSSLRADEIVFYDERAMVMNYLVEFSA